MRGLTSRQPNVVEWSVSWPRGYAASGLVSTHGARLMDSTPPATVTAASPTAMARSPAITASSPEPHSRLTVAPGTDVGKPASSAAMRATSRLSSPAPLASPNQAWSMSAGSRSGTRSPSARRAWAEVVGPHPRQSPAVAPDRGAHRVDDVAHDADLTFTRRRGRRRRCTGNSWNGRMRLSSP